MVFKKFGNDNAQQGGFQRQMTDVSDLNIKCRDCKTPITQLPFNPDPSRTDSLRCLDCVRKFRDRPQQRNFQREMTDVSDLNIKCRDCKTPITQLPFNPDPSRTDSLRCRDCMRKSRGE